MASENSKKLQRALAPILKAHGFKKDGTTWRKDHPETIAVFNIQSSRWGPQFYINLGIVFRELNPVAKPREYECHIRQRLEGWKPDSARLDELLDFEREITEAVRFSELEQIVVLEALPFFERLNSQAGAKENIHRYPFTPVTLATRTHLGLPLP